MGKLNRVPTDEEVAKSMRVDLDKITKIRGSAAKMSSLDAPIDEEGGNEIIDLIEDKTTASPEQEINKFFTNERLAGLLGFVNEREHEDLNLRFGLVGGRTHTLAEVSKKMRVSRERVRQIEENALKKLKKFISSQEEEAMR